MEALTPLLKRLDELLQFDLGGQQRAASQARQINPRTPTTSWTLSSSACRPGRRDRGLCSRAGGARRRGLLTPLQLREAHNKIVQLKSMLSEAEGQAKALDAREATTRIDCMKTYAFPSQQYLEHLRGRTSWRLRISPRVLKGEPGALFEIKLQPKALRNGAIPSPMYVRGS
ncbi:hypothetical protein ABIC03_007648 [Bradyrhizobium sp. RT6a]